MKSYDNNLILLDILNCSVPISGSLGSPKLSAHKYESCHHCSATVAFKPNNPITILFFYELFSAIPTHLIGNFIWRLCIDGDLLARLYKIEHFETIPDFTELRKEFRVWTFFGYACKSQKEKCSCTQLALQLDSW